MSFKGFMQAIKNCFSDHKTPAKAPAKQSPTTKAITVKKSAVPTATRSAFFWTMPLVLSDGHHLSKHHIPLVPSTSSRIFKELYRFKIDYTLLSHRCLLIENFNETKYDRFRDSRTGNRVSEKIRPLKNTPRQFASWAEYLPHRHFKAIKFCYLDAHGMHVRELPKDKDFNEADYNKYSRPGVEFQFLLFEDTKHAGDQYSINGDGTIYSFTKVPDIKNIARFVKALIKYELD